MKIIKPRLILRHFCIKFILLNSLHFCNNKFNQWLINLLAPTLSHSHSYNVSAAAAVKKTFNVKRKFSIFLDRKENRKEKSEMEKSVQTRFLVSTLPENYTKEENLKHDKLFRVYFWIHPRAPEENCFVKISEITCSNFTRTVMDSFFCPDAIV